MTTATKPQLTLLERQQAHLEKLTNEAGALEVDIARLQEKKRLLREETARTAPSRLASLVRVGGPVAQIERDVSKKEARLRNVREEASALGVAIQESQSQLVGERTEAYRARQHEIHERELEALDRVFESFNELARVFHDDYGPIVAEAHQLLGEARSEGLVSPANENVWGQIARPAITPPKDFEHFLVDCFSAAFRRGNVTVARVYEEKVEPRGHGGAPNPYQLRAESS